MKRDSTKLILRKMLKENTGSHMCDSGGAYGRNHERNQTRQFDSEPEATVEFNVYELNNGKTLKEMDVTLSVYRFLAERLTYDSLFQRRFESFANRKQYEDDSWLSIEEEFVKHIGATTPLTDRAINTYNHDSLLSQIIQYLPFEYNGESFVVLQIHGGCDARGGYTKPRIFRRYDDDYSIFDDARATVYCTGEERHRWFTDDAGCTWENDESDAELKDARFDGETKKGYCPVCDSELLAAGF